jgi:hypothetical protein
MPDVREKRSRIRVGTGGGGWDRGPEKVQRQTYTHLCSVKHRDERKHFHSFELLIILPWRWRISYDSNLHIHRLDNLKSHILKISLKFWSFIFCDITSCNVMQKTLFAAYVVLVSCLTYPPTLKMEAKYSSETLVDFHQTTRPDIPKDPENLKSYKILHRMAQDLRLFVWIFSVNQVLYGKNCHVSGMTCISVFRLRGYKEVCTFFGFRLPRRLI